MFCLRSQFYSPGTLLVFGLIALGWMTVPFTAVASPANSARTSPVSLMKSEAVFSSPLVEPIPKTGLRARLRAISGKGSLPPWERITSSRLDTRVQDLHQKLLTMPKAYEQYSLVCDRSGDVPYAKKKVMRLANRHVVTLRTLRDERGHILRVKWEDEHGKALLDTRMRYEEDRMLHEPLLVGVEKGPEEGLFLAIDLSRD
jgi:hypothetical protein